MSTTTTAASHAVPADTAAAAQHALTADTAAAVPRAVPADLAAAPSSAGAPSAPTSAHPTSPFGAPPGVAKAATTAADPLAELRGIHLPEPVGFWPPAPGWWGLAALLVVAGVASLVVARRRRRSVVRHALRELDGLTRTSADADLQTLATTLSALVRRVALLRFGRARVASLHGAAWHGFLTETAPKRRRRRARFAEDARLVLSLAPYAPAGAHCLTRDGRTVDRGMLIAATRAWIEENA